MSFNGSEGGNLIGDRHEMLEYPKGRGDQSVRLSEGEVSQVTLDQADPPLHLARFPLQFRPTAPERRRGLIQTGDGNPRPSDGQKDAPGSRSKFENLAPGLPRLLDIEVHILTGPVDGNLVVDLRGEALVHVLTHDNPLFQLFTQGAVPFRGGKPAPGGKRPCQPRSDPAPCRGAKGDKGMSGSHDIIGQPHWRVDGIGKVTGSARFGADLAAPGMLYGAVLLACRPHATVRSISTHGAERLPGVQAVLTAEDLPAARCFGTVVKNLPVLVSDRVRFYGDGLAIVAAEDPRQAADAAAAIQVEYDELAGVFDAEDALKRPAPELHPNAASSDLQNVCARHHVNKGDLQAGMAEADVILTRTFRTSTIEHAYLEPEAVLAECTEDGGVRVTGSIQNIFSTRRAMSEVLNLDLARITVKHAALGGSFGGKDEVMTQMACRAALLARATGRPVKMVHTREESMCQSYKRHPYVLHYRVGAKKDGRLTAIEARIIADAGAYASMSPFVTWRSTVQATGPYECPHVSVEVVAAYTNNVYTGAMRGFGSPQVNFAIESLIDELAERLTIDPLALREKNIFREGSITATGQPLPPGVSLDQVLARATERAQWTELRDTFTRDNETRTDGRRRGLGLACSYRGVSLGAEGVDAAGALVSVQTDGSVLVSIGLTDMGQGVSSTMALIAAEVLGVDVSRVKFFPVHTGRVPDSGPTVASRSTIMGGQATKKAAEKIRDGLLDVAAEMLETSAADLRMARGRVVSAVDSQSLPFGDVVARAFAAGRPLFALGWHRAPHTSWDEKRGCGEAYFTFVYGANIAEVEVDLDTGRVEVKRVVAVHDVGRAISPAMVRSQVYGGVVMGLGYALLEDYVQEQGMPLVRNLDEYLLPTLMDTPQIDVDIVENPDSAGPFGAKSIGEPATELAAPAIINAIAHATGRRILTLPADLETVLLGHPLRRPPKRAAELARDVEQGEKSCGL